MYILILLQADIIRKENRLSRQYDDWYFSSGEYLREPGVTEWVELNDYPTYYICKEGYVMHNGKILKPHRGDKAGHLNIRFGKKRADELKASGIPSEPYVHRLVAETFIHNVNNDPVVRHLDDDVDNNHVDNLAWGTQRDNHNDCVRNGNYKPFTDVMREKSYSKSRRPVICHTPDGSIEEYRGVSEAARLLNLQESNVWKVLNKERKHTCGYTFEYK